MKIGGRRISIRRTVLPMLMIVGGALGVRSYVAAKMVQQTPIEKEDSAQVASWSVEVESIGGSTVNLMAGGATQAYSLAVTNNSDLASNYVVHVSGVPTGVRVGLDVASDSDLQTPVGGELTFINTGGALSYIAENNQNVRTHILTLKADNNATAVEGANMAVEVQFAQAQPQRVQQP